MSDKVKFCPECGADLDGKKFCPQCGYDVHKEVYDPPGEVTTASLDADYVGFANGQPNPVWDKLSSYMKDVGKWTPLIFLIVPAVTILIYLLAGIPMAILGLYGTWIISGLWSFILVPGALIALAFLWVKPKFGDPILKGEYYKLIENALNFKGVSIPWMLIISLIIFIVGVDAWWLGWLLFIPSLMILLFGPEPYVWYSGKRRAEQEKKKAEKKKNKPKKEKKKKKKKQDE